MAEPLRIEPATPTLVSLASKTESPRFRQDLLAVHGLLAGRVLALTGQPAEAEGRVVISGRMADVCAELDRLAALEAAGTTTEAKQLH